MLKEFVSIFHYTPLIAVIYLHIINWTRKMEQHLRYTNNFKYLSFCIHLLRLISLECIYNSSFPATEKQEY